MDNPYYGEVVTGARAAAAEAGYTLLVTSSEGEYEAERRAVELLQAKEVDGLIVTPVLDGAADLSHLFELKRRNFPFVLLEEIRGVPASLVDVDNVEASRKAVEFLIGQGHSRIAHFAGPAYSTHSQQRVDGVRHACSGSHVILTAEDIVPAGAHMEDGYRAGLAYFRDRARGDRPTAVTCYNDLVALGLCRALARAGAARARRRLGGGLRRHPAAGVPPAAPHLGARPQVGDGAHGRADADPPHRGAGGAPAPEGVRGRPGWWCATPPAPCAGRRARPRGGGRRHRRAGGGRAMTADSHSRGPPGRGPVPGSGGGSRAPRDVVPSYRTFTRFPKGEMS